MEQQSSSTQPSNSHPAGHTLQTDLARALDTTEASAVQELLQTAKEKERAEIEKHKTERERVWYNIGGFILLILALGACAFGIFYYRNLTVTVAPKYVSGVFQTLEPIVATTSIDAVLSQKPQYETLPPEKLFVVPLIKEGGVPLTPEEVFSFFEMRASEPFIATISNVRYGVFNTGTTVSSFLILSTPTPELATKELLIAEPTLLSMTAPILGIDQTKTNQDIGTSFESTYMYNLPVRLLKTTNIDTREQTILMYYAYATDNTIVIATNPSILKAVYDTIIRQQ